MSYDLQLPRTCNHRIYRELAVLGDDHRTLEFRQPLSSSASVQVFASDKQVPKTEYTIIYDPKTLEINQPRVVYLNRKWRSLEDYWELNYVTFRNFCPQCVGLTALDDISYNNLGGLNVSRNEKLLLQNMEKFTVTELGSNVFHDFIGTTLTTLLGDKMEDPDFLATKVTQEINTTLEKLVDLQQQYQNTGRTLTDGEILDTIEDIDVTIDEEDPTILKALVTVTAQSGNSVDFEQYLKIR